jgi:AcrR family transcriptional regulator
VAIGRDETRSRPDRRVGKTRKALKQALTDLILEKGYEGVTVQDVIDRADVGRSTFYAHFIDKDDLLMAILADLEMPGLDPSSWKPDDPAFGWTLALFRHFGSVKRLFKAVASSPLARRETTQRLEDLARAELSRLNAARQLDAFQLETVVRFLVGTFIGFMDWWMREESEHLPAEQVDHAFRSLVLPGLANVLELELELPKSLYVRGRLRGDADRMHRQAPSLGSPAPGSPGAPEWRPLSR